MGQTPPSVVLVAMMRAGMCRGEKEAIFIPAVPVFRLVTRSLSCGRKTKQALIVKVKRNKPTIPQAGHG